MRIGIAGPASLKMLTEYVANGDYLPEGYLFAPMATWVEGLIRHDHKVSLFTLAPGIERPIDFYGDDLTIHVGRYRQRGRGRDFFAQERRDLLSSMRSDPVDIIHAHWTYEFALAALDSGIPNLVTAHDAPLSVLGLQPTPYRLSRAIMAWYVCRRVHTIAAVSPYIESHFRRYYLYTKDMYVVPNGVSPLVFGLGQNSDKKNHDKFVFASILMGWAGNKNGQTLIKAFSQVRQKVRNVELWMFGLGHGPGEEAHQWANSHSFSNDIRFFGQTPYLKMIEQIAQNVDVLVHPALMESFSMAIAEAMALGIPVIGGMGSGAVPYTLKGGGVLVDVRSANDIAKAMLHMVENPNICKQLGAMGKRIAKENYTIGKMLSQYEQLYMRIIDEFHSQDMGRQKRDEH